MYFPIFRANVAVMRFLLAAHRSAHRRVELRELRDRWSRYGLRDRDLDLSVARLESLGFVDVDRARGHQYLMLTGMGRRSAYSTLGLIESLVLVPRTLAHLLGQLGLRSPGRQRRNGDRRHPDRASSGRSPRRRTG